MEFIYLGGGRGKERCAFHPFIATHLKISKSKREIFDIIILKIICYIITTHLSLNREIIPRFEPNELILS